MNGILTPNNANQWKTELRSLLETTKFGHLVIQQTIFYLGFLFLGAYAGFYAC